MQASVHVAELDAHGACQVYLIVAREHPGLRDRDKNRRVRDGEQLRLEVAVDILHIEQSI